MALSPRKIIVEDRIAPLDATSDQPALFDGTTRLYMSYTCPFAQRVWIIRNLKVTRLKKLKMNKMVAYTQTKTDSDYTVNYFKKFMNQIFERVLLLNTYSSMASPIVVEERPALLDATADPPALFDGTTRLYTSYVCPFAQRVWITRNFKGLQEKIKLVPLDLGNRPAWYKEKVYPENKVPALEHNGKIIGESLDLIKYLDNTFEGPSLYPEDHAKREFGDELLKYTDTFVKTMYMSLKGDPFRETGENIDCSMFRSIKGEIMEDMTGMFFFTAAPVLDYLENALYKFDDGPFFLGQLSLVDIAYIPFVERFQIVLNELLKCDITAERPKLSSWIEQMNKIDGYAQTKIDPKEIVEIFKKKFM
ncbi:hypothetical protein CARUB_v10003856mg, partial [Capsella rubella]